MKVEKFDFRRLQGTWDDLLVGRRVILDNTIDDILDAVENGIDKGEILTKGQTDDAPFWSEENGEWFWYAYVLDEDFVEEPLAEVRWFREDVGVALDKRVTGRDVTDDDIDAVIDGTDWEALEGVMIEHGWVVVDTAVDEYLRGQENA